MSNTVIKGLMTPVRAFKGTRDYLNTRVAADQLTDEISFSGILYWLGASCTSISGWAWLWAPFQLVLNVVGGALAVVCATLENIIPVIREGFISQYAYFTTLPAQSKEGGASASREPPRAVLIIPLFILALLSELVGGVAGVIVLNAYAARDYFSDYKAWARIVYRPVEPKAPAVEPVPADDGEPKEPITYPWYVYPGLGVGVFVGTSTAFAINAGIIAYEIVRDTMAFWLSSLHSEPSSVDVKVGDGETTESLDASSCYPARVDAKGSHTWDRVKASFWMKCLMWIPMLLGAIMGTALSIMLSVWHGCDIGFRWMIDHLESVKARDIGSHFAYRRYMDASWEAINDVELLQLPVVFVFKLPFFIVPALVGAVIASSMYALAVIFRDVAWQWLVALEIALDMDFGFKLSPDFYSMRLQRRYKDTHKIQYNFKARSPWRMLLRLPSLVVGVLGGAALIVALSTIRTTVRAVVMAFAFLMGLIPAVFSWLGGVWDWLFSESYTPVSKGDWAEHAAAHHIDCTGAYVNSADEMWVKPTNPLFTWCQAFWRQTRWGSLSATERAVEVIGGLTSASTNEISAADVRDRLEQSHHHMESWTQSRYQRVCEDKAVDWLVEAHKALERQDELVQPELNYRYTLFDHMREQAFDRVTPSQESSI